MLKTAIGRLRVIGFVEGLSYIALLFVAMPMKYFWGMPKAVSITGMAHGVLFVLYCISILEVKFRLGWNLKRAFIAFVASLIPFGTFVFDRSLAKEEARLKESS